MTRTNYREQLATLRSDVVAMGETTLERYQKAIEVLESGDSAVADRIIETDEEVNQLYLELEGDCIELIALQQPVARDLRFIASSFKIVTDIERIGDLATNLARYGRESDGTVGSSADVGPIAEDAGDMVASALGAYEGNDAAAARAIAARDDGLDDRCEAATHDLVRHLLQTRATQTDGDLDAELDPVSRTLLTIRDLERVGDHAVNICARTCYMVDNDDDLLY